jgi:hypothetical protein
VRLATQFDRIHGAGAEIVAVSVDDEVRQAGMAHRWGLPAIRFVADPGGDRFLRPLDLFDPDDRGGIALPALVVVDPDGEERFRHLSRDFADRTGDDDVLEALEALHLPAVEQPSWTYDAEVPEDLSGYFRTDNLWPYMRGNMYGAIAISRRLQSDDASPETVAVAKQHQAMASSMAEAIDEWKTNFNR